jgi:hypothetical protein
MANQLTHSVRLYFPFSFDSNARPSDYHQFITNIKNRETAELITSAAYLNANVHANLAKAKLWNPTNYKIDKRIHPFGHKLVNGLQTSVASEGFFGFQPLKLSNEAIRVLNQGSPNNLGSGVTVSLRSSATKRLEAMGFTSPLLAEQAVSEDSLNKQDVNPNNWPMMFNDIWFYGFNMGVGMLVVDVSFCRPGKNSLSVDNLESLQEINYVICRNSNDHQSPNINWGAEHTVKSSKGLSSLVDALMPEDIGNPINLKKTSDWSNTYSYIYLASDQPVDIQQRKDASFRLARKYNDRYLPEQTESQIEYFHPFKSMTHSFSLEGAATYIDLNAYQGDIPETINNFHTSAIPQAYSALILLTYAEYLFLREMATNTEDDDRVDMRSPTSENLERLRDFRTKLYDFRLNFRYTQISGNTNHNLFCNHNKNALEIADLLQEISSDAQEIEQFIADHVSQQQEQRLKKFGILGSLFAVIIGWVDLWGLNMHGIFFENADIEPASMSAFLIGLLVLSGLVIVTSRSPKTKKSKVAKRQDEQEPSDPDSKV